MKLNSLVVSSLAVGALAVPTALDNHVVHEKRDLSPHSQWTKRAALDSNARIPVRIALKQRNLENGMDYIMKVSDPKSPDYGKYYSTDDVVSLFSPEQETVDSVTSWLVSAGVPKDSIHLRKSQGWIAFDTTAGQLESLLKTKYHTYEHKERGGKYVGTDEYKLPSEVSGHIDFISPGIAFSAQGKTTMGSKARPVVPMPPALAASAVEDCTKKITPACVRQMYNISRLDKAVDGNDLGIFELDPERYSQEDLDAFYSQYATEIPKGTAPTLASVNGGEAPTDQPHAGGEADLDFEIALPLIYPQGSADYQVVGQDDDDLFDSFLDAVDGTYCNSSNQGDCGTFKPVPVISFSWGASEVDWPTNYLKRQCNEYMKLGLQGTTLVFASGDDGVARRGGACLGKKHNIYTPDAQGGCPYITAIGSTYLPAGSKPGDPEVATTSFSSGGGFSNIYTSPDYQKDAISTYFSEHDPGYKSYETSNGTIPDNGGIYNRAGRGYPDLSAAGDNGAFIIRGKQVLSGGTSMSAPLVASIFTRINIERSKAGKSPIGFVNPTLYQHPEMFRDVVVGNQDKGGPYGDGNPSACGNKGFSAAKGWDPVTGLGTPDYPAMLEVFLSQ